MDFEDAGATNYSAWNEDDWERFLQQEDVRTAKFQELYESLCEDPRRNELIIRELGLSAPCEGIIPEGSLTNGNCHACEERVDCEFHELCMLIDPSELCNDDYESEEMLAAFDEVERIPAYQCAHEFAMVLQNYFEICPVGHAFSGNYNGNHSERVWRLLDAAALVAAQLAGGHGIGYDPDCICGNIANCKRALKNALYCRESLQLMNMGLRDGRALLRKADELNAMIIGWIGELRSMIY